MEKTLIFRKDAAHVYKVISANQFICVTTLKGGIGVGEHGWAFHMTEKTEIATEKEFNKAMIDVISKLATIAMG
ncbi:MAG: hypothetical protein A2W17_06215 [Planctomycetes bacterium RBG_16_41_13]|nr:MAG: hypothetical protein A2W17_06215 [Planctomycetes bacterium RBG_16_41_13]